MGSKRNLVRFLAVLVVLAVMIAMPLTAIFPSGVVGLRALSVVGAAETASVAGVDSCSLPRKAQCNLYAYNPNDHGVMLRMAAA